MNKEPDDDHHDEYKEQQEIKLRGASRSYEHGREKYASGYDL